MKIFRLDKMHAALAFVLLAVVFVSFNALNGLLFGGVRVDLTEQGLYSLSEGSLEIIDSIEEPVQLYFFFSDKETVNTPSIRNYARRVRELLDEYVSYSGGSLQLQVLDPEPFSVIEERASEFGLQAAQSQVGGASVYFGLVAVDSIDRHKSIPFFDVERETLLEYEITRLLHSVLNPQKPVVGVLSAVSTREVVPGTRGGQTRMWTSLRQVRESFTLRELPLDVSSIPEDINVLLAVRPSHLEATALYALDQYLLRGGKALIFADSYNGIAADEQGGGQMLPGNQFAPMLASWGMAISPEVTAVDPGLAMTVNAGGRSVRHLAYLALQNRVINADDVVTAQLDSINMGIAGVLEILEPQAQGGDQQDKAPSERSFDVLLHTGPDGGSLTLQGLSLYQDVTQLQRFIRPDRGKKNLAVRFSGAVESSFSGPPGASTGNESFPEHIAQSEDVNLIVVADTDMLTDQYWVRVQNFLGRQFTTALSDNGNLLLNALENLSGSSALIRVRSRGRFSRPFLVVEEIRKNANERYSRQEKELQDRLSAANRELTALQQQTRSAEGEDRLDLKREQRQTIAKFKEQRRDIRRQLRQVRHQLNSDIDRLDVRLRFLNVILMPLILVFVLFFCYRLYAMLVARRYN